MARVRLYEYDAKTLLFPECHVMRASLETSSSEIAKTFGTVPLVVKVDQGVKKRGKQGLVAVDVKPVEAVAKMREWSDRGFSHFLIEPLMTHEPSEEKYLSFERGRHGWKVLASDQGGIDIESAWDSIKVIDSRPYTELLAKCEKYHIVFLELNPFVVEGEKMIPLDAAALIDDAALSLVDLVRAGIQPVEDRVQSPSEKAVALLDDSTPASLKFRLVNPEGKIWMLLSGGGASLVLADEVADVGLGEELANYGEYSGAPSDDDTYSYTKIILNQLLKNRETEKQALVIAGGVANFTDVAKTFRGVIRAMEEKKKELVKAGVRVFVRRGGPNEKKGLAMMQSFLENAGLLGSLYGHDIPLTQVITDIKKYLASDGVRSSGKRRNAQ
jgi:succinyl-CoA synthetase beta subunit